MNLQGAHAGGATIIRGVHERTEPNRSKAFFWLALWIVGLAGSSAGRGPAWPGKGRGPLGGMDCITIVWTARASVPSRINVKFQARLMPAG